jgi:signal transduction histidine kinase
MERQQTKWVILGSTAAVVALVMFGVTLVWPPAEGTATVLMDLLLIPAAQLLRVLLPVTIFVAILRHRLWDIDLILNRTLVYGGLTASVMAIYVLSVGVIGTLVQAGLAGLGSVVATGLVALLVQPLRDRLQRGVNRLMYGERDDPVTVLSRLGQKLEAVISPEALLPALAETVAQALKLPFVAIELGGAEGAAETVTYPAGRARPGETVDLPLMHQGDSVGRLCVAPRAPGEPFSPLDRHLLEDIARQAGLAVHAVGLTRELQRARQRSVAALEEERRRLRRDLHDGLGPALASQGLKLAAIKQHLKGQVPAALALIDDVLAQNHETVADVRRLVYGLRPPALDERGLAEAIRDQLGQGGVDPVQITVNDLPAHTPPLPAAVEVAAYRIALEALTNVLRHARAGQAAVRFALAEAPAALQVEIEDDGAGLPAGLRAGVGLRSMRERAEELGGRLSVAPGARGGTCVRATLPLAQVL